MEVWSNGSHLFVEQEHMEITDCVTGLHISRLPGKHIRAGCIWCHPQLLSALGGPAETVVPQTFQEGTSYRLENGEEITSGVQLLHRPNISRSSSQPRKYHCVLGHIDVVLLILFLLLCIKPIFLCCSKTVELRRGKEWHWRRGLGNR